MKIRTNQKIQRAVDKRQGHVITHLTALHACAVTYATDENEEQVESTSEIAIDAFHNGVQNGAKLATKLSKTVLALWSRYRSAPPKDFGIYVAFQETSDGTDYLYFIGRPKEIIAKIEKYPATE